MQTTKLPEMKPVQSSNIHSVGYDQSGKRLYVKFGNGAVWSYADVSEEKAKDMMAAKSVGSFIAKEIKFFHDGRREGGGAHG